jgi:ATP-dependent DNA ligase
MKKFPVLYKKTSTGSIQFWEIWVNPLEVSAEIRTKYGKLHTDSPQYTLDVISEGKNIGKKNATTPEQQAEAEAQAKWEKQKKKGYVESIDDAQTDKLDDLIEGGIVPMLAQKFSEHGHKIKLPCYTQPKLDGIRCIAIVKNGACTLWSRTRKPITSCPHIVQELEAAFETKDIVLDGELYNHDMKKDFEKIVSLVRQEEPAEGHEIVQYHVYDLINDGVFAERMQEIDTIFGNFDFYALKKVPTEPVNAENDIMIYFDKFREQGYEGAMLRNEFSKYVNKRSYDLQKVKEFDDAEFEIIGVDEGRGKLAGHVGAFRCRTADGKEFLAKMSGETGRLRDYFTNHSLWSGKRLTVQYQGLTGKEGVPRFPVGIAIRDYE